MIAPLIAAATLALALAAPPPGFYEVPALDARAAWVAGKPVQAYCATDPVAWQTYISQLGNAPANVSPEGYTPTIGGQQTYLASDVCAVLRARLGRHSVSLSILGAALDVLTHESLHMSGETDEGQTECNAIHALPAFLVARWGFKKGSAAFRNVMLGAWRYHNRLGAQYRTVC